MAKSSSPPTSEGFTAIPRKILDLLLCLPLNKREFAILLLVARLTYGCRNTRWAYLKQADLAVIGIGPTHANNCLRSLLDRNLLLQNGRHPLFRLNEALLASSVDDMAVKRLDHLAVVVGRNLGETSQFGKPVPKKGTLPLPKREVLPYQDGNVARALDWSFSRSRGKFEKDFDTS